MLRSLLAMLLASAPAAAWALPPPTGAMHTFDDPTFEGTVVCDTFEQVREIATSDRPGDVYLAYLATPNALNEPTCAAVTPTGLVLDVKPIGVMREDDLHFQAYAVEAQFGQTTAFVLYLERFDMVRA